MDKKTVLIAEDEQALSSALKLKLESFGYDVRVAENGEAVIEMLKSGLKPDIILMDILMPKIDGIEAIKQIRQMEGFENQEIMALTNLYDSETVRKVMIYNVFNYVVKSDYSLEEIVKKVQHQIA